MAKLDSPPTQDALVDSSGKATSTFLLWLQKLTGVNSFVGLPVYADNAAALAGKLKTGDAYRTSTGQVMVVY